MPEYHGAIVVSMLVEHEAHGSARQQLRQLCLALVQGQRPQILAVELQKIERV